MKSVRRHRVVGFTLLEVMLALLLLALLLAGTVGAVRTAVHAMHSGELAIDRMSRLRVAQEFIRHQVSRILPLAFGRDDSTGANFVFDGKADLMRFVAPMPGYLSKGGPYVQTLRLVGNRHGGRQLVFTAQMLNGYDESVQGGDIEPAVLLDEIADGRFEFRRIDENGELTDWSDQWDDPAVTPVMVRLTMRMKDAARVEFPEMDIPLLLDAGAVRQQMPFAMRNMPGMRLDEAQRAPLAPHERPNARKQ